MGYSPSGSLISPKVPTLWVWEQLPAIGRNLNVFDPVVKLKGLGVNFLK